MTATNVFSAIADPTRRAILDLLALGSRTAGNIAAQFPRLTQPGVSRHLKVLRDAQLVDVTINAQQRVYAIKLDGAGMTLGDTGTLTGAVSIDASSMLFAGNGANPVIQPFAAGQLVTVTNAGTIDLTNGGSPAMNSLTIVGNYVGAGGSLHVNTVPTARRRTSSSSRPAAQPARPRCASPMRAAPAL